MTVLHLQKVGGISGSEAHLLSLLPELQEEEFEPALDGALSSGTSPISRPEVVALLARHGIAVESEEAARTLVR